MELRDPNNLNFKLVCYNGILGGKGQWYGIESENLVKGGLSLVVGLALIHRISESQL